MKKLSFFHTPFFCVYDEPSAGKALPQTIIFTLDKMISFKKEKNYGFN